MNKNKIEENYNRNKELINILIENSFYYDSTFALLVLLGLHTQVVNYTYESCSFIIGLPDKKTVVEVCFSPSLIYFGEEPNNPIFECSVYKPEL